LQQFIGRRVACFLLQNGRLLLDKREMRGEMKILVPLLSVLLALLLCAQFSTVDAGHVDLRMVANWYTTSFLAEAR